MSDLTDVLERAERALESLPLPSDGFEQLRRYRNRRHRRNRMMAGAVALLVAAGGALGSVALLRAIRPASLQHPAARISSSPSAMPSAVPAGEIYQRSIGGQPAQQLGSFWFGITDENSCLSVRPLAIGPSWTFQDGGHDCLSRLGSAAIRVGQARGAVHRDGDPGPSTEFNAVYGLVTQAAARIDMVWSTGEVATVRPVNGRFMLAWSSSAWPLRVTVFSAGGKKLSAMDLTPP